MMDRLARIARRSAALLCGKVVAKQKDSIVLFFLLEMRRDHQSSCRSYSLRARCQFPPWGFVPLTALHCAGVNLIVLALFPLRDNYAPVHIQRQRGEFRVAPG